MSGLSFSGRATTPLVLQSEAAECGLACLAMVAAHFGYRTDLATLRSRHSVSLKGTTLTHLMAFASQLNLSSRPLRLDMESVGKLQLPAILHWDLNHFVVLTEVRRQSVVILDPARGRVRLPLDERIEEAAFAHQRGVEVPALVGRGLQRGTAHHRPRLVTVTEQAVPKFVHERGSLRCKRIACA